MNRLLTDEDWAEIGRLEDSAQRAKVQAYRFAEDAIHADSTEESARCIRRMRACHARESGARSLIQEIRERGIEAIRAEVWPA